MRSDDKDIFDDDKLWEELNGADRERRSTALRVLDALGKLAVLRTVSHQLRYDLVWDQIYSTTLLHQDTQRGDGDVRCDAAAAAWDQLSQLVELRETAEDPTTPADRRWARAASVITSKPASRDRLKTGQFESFGDADIYCAVGVFVKLAA